MGCDFTFRFSGDVSCFRLQKRRTSSKLDLLSIEGGSLNNILNYSFIIKVRLINISKFSPLNY